MYRKLIPLENGEEQQFVMKISNNAFIPFDPANTDYQEYLEWVADGGVPEEADA